MTIKTFDANRVGGGTFSLEQDATTGEYKLKEVGFVKLPTLKLPEIEQAAYKAPTPYIPGADEDDDTGTGNTNTGGGEGGDRVDFTGATQLENIQEEATGGDMMKDATTLSSQLNRVDRTDVDQGAVKVEDISNNPRRNTALKSYNNAINNYNTITGNIRELNASGQATDTSRKEYNISLKNAQDQLKTAREQYEYESGLNLEGTASSEIMKSAPTIGDFSAGARTIGDPSLASDKFKYARGPQSVNVVQDKNLMSTAKDVVTNLKSVSIADVIQKAASLSPTLSVIRAVGSANEAANTENTTALRSGGYQTDFQGKIIGKDGQSINAADSVFGGMNSRSAMGDISKGAQSRIDTISKTISKMTPAQLAKSSLPARKAKFEKELLDHNTERARSREDKSGATGTKKGGFTNPGANSYGPHSGGGGGDPGCFIKGTLITMLDGSKKPVEKVDLGDNVAVGGKVFAVGRFLNTELYDYKGIKVSGSHMVNEDGTWLRVRDTKHGKSLGDDLNTVYVFGSENRRILIDDILFTDYFEVSEQDQLINNEEDFFNNWKSYGNIINEHNVNTLNAN